MKKERKEALVRILVAIVTGIILSIWSVLVKVLGVINWLIALITAKRNKGIAMFCEYWNAELYKFARYLTGVSNRRPFPFSKMERISKFERK